MESIKKHIRDIPDFPKPGILFRDITPLLLDPGAFREVVQALETRYKPMNIEKIVAIESRGFMFGAPLALRLGTGIIPLRKPGKLPYDTISQSYELEYGKATLEMHKDAVTKGDRVLIFDDLIATGGTAEAAVGLIKKLGGEVVEVGVVIELAALRGKERLGGVPFFSLISYD